MKEGYRKFSSNLAIRGAFIEETYRIANRWDLLQSAENNLKRVKESNLIGARSQSWLKKILAVVRHRFDFGGSERPLIELVQQGWSLDEWRPLLLWHMSRTDELLKTFLIEWLFEKYESGIVIISTEPVIEFLRQIVKKRLGTESSWKENTIRRVASGLLKIATEFQLMRGRIYKQFSAYQLPDRSFVYLLHALMEREQNTRKVVAAIDWRLFLIKPAEVEEDLLRLHQHGQLHFERAGSFLELTLPSGSTSEFVRSTVS
jgi:hypothetical protein